MKKKILVIGITMAAAGSEKSFLSFAKNAIDYDKYDVDLLLAKKTGAFLDAVPKEIRILEMGKGGEIFLINRKNAAKTILKRHLLPNPFRVFGLLPHIIGRCRAKTAEEKDYASDRMWVELMRALPALEGEYDAALAYWGDHTMFYMCEKVKAKTKWAWLHFDYSNPPREDALYLHYFSQCDKIVTVSKTIEHSLKEALPQIADKVITMENIIDQDEILRLAEASYDFGDDFDGIRFLTVGRICHQKGQDLAVLAIARLVREGYPIRWYLMGDGTEEDKAALRRLIEEYGLEDRVICLGIRQNPYPYMKACDLYLQPSRHEGKPIAVEEAKIFGKPIFLTDFDTAREQMQNYFASEIGEISSEGLYFGLKKLLDGHFAHETGQK